ncbi:MAG TPA: CHAT domain-containing tetratricopeptide repeat protein [Bacteroidales bacterium]|nr:CHAT domain-containing tetratricopeptide repeat protein [Bacteroidales bacterium]
MLNYFNEFSESYRAGNFLKAELSLRAILELPIDEYVKCSTYSNLGSICIVLGRFDEALDYFGKAEILNPEGNDGKYLLAGIFINKAIIYRNRRSFANAKEYFEKGIRLYNDVISINEQYLRPLATAYYNFGIYYFTVGEYQISLDYYRKSIEIKQKLRMPVYLELMNSAKAYAGMNEVKMADRYFKEGLARMIAEQGKDNFRLVDFSFGYAQFLQATGNHELALENYRNGLRISLQSFGIKNTITSLAYKNLGDYYEKIPDYDSSLFYYQKSLISVVEDFNDKDVYKNPKIDSSILDIRLLDNLKAKASAFERKALQEKDVPMKVKDLNASLNTIELSLDLIEIIKNNFPSEESQLYLADNEKETYMSAIRISSELYSITGDKDFPGRMFSIAQKAKASILRNRVRQNDILYSASIPDSLRQKQRNLSIAVASYNKNLRDEVTKKDHDNSKIGFWKDQLFILNREKEDIDRKIAAMFPQYIDLVRRMEPVTYDEIRTRLKKDETVIDYILSNEYTGGYRQLYVFIISKKGLQFISMSLDKEFKTNALLLRNITDPSLEEGRVSRFHNFSTAMHYMYNNLFFPIEKMIDGKRLIIIPDEEIAWLPFETFLKKLPADDAYDFENQDFLIRHYSFSYGYAASLLSKLPSPGVRKPEVLSFSPSYGMNNPSIDSLEGAMNEIREIDKIFKGRAFIREDATKENFRNGMLNPAVLHLAMHSISDSINSLYSYLLFSPSKNDENSRLYNYEISLSRVNTPMIVLSSCNSGTGTLFSGEGLMSLARSFILAGARSVVRTAWEVNDESGSAIITGFYYYLSKGKRKDDALRLAKLNFIRNSPPAYSDPYYWAAYEVLGDNEPIVDKKTKIVTIVTISVLLVAGICIYLRRRNIFSDRSI